MLVLSRRNGERIRLSNGITILICRIKGQTVRIGIEAPGEVSIWREELEAKRCEHTGPCNMTRKGRSEKSG